MSAVKRVFDNANLVGHLCSFMYYHTGIYSLRKTNKYIRGLDVDRFCKHLEPHGKQIAVTDLTKNIYADFVDGKMHGVRNIYMSYYDYTSGPTEPDSLVSERCQFKFDEKHGDEHIYKEYEVTHNKYEHGKRMDLTLVREAGTDDILEIADWKALRHTRRSRCAKESAVVTECENKKQIDDLLNFTGSAHTTHKRSIRYMYDSPCEEMSTSAISTRNREDGIVRRIFLYQNNRFFPVERGDLISMNVSYKCKKDECNCIDCVANDKIYNKQVAKRQLALIPSLCSLTRGLLG